MDGTRRVSCSSVPMSRLQVLDSLDAVASDNRLSAPCQQSMRRRSSRHSVVYNAFRSTNGNL